MKRLFLILLIVALGGCSYGIDCVDTKTNQYHGFYGSARTCNQVEDRCLAMDGGEVCDKWKDLKNTDQQAVQGAQNESYIPGLKVQPQAHAYKHTLQSSYLGPFYGIAYGISKIPSLYSDAPGWMDRQADVYASNPDNWVKR